MNFPVVAEGKEQQVAARPVSGGSGGCAAILEQRQDFIILAQLSRSRLAWCLGRRGALPVAVPPARP